MGPSLSDLRIGYAPYDETLTRPGDKRRFLAYARKRNVKFEMARFQEKYDVLVLTAGADVTHWIRYPGHDTKIIYDFVDSYLAIPKWQVKGMLRGTAKYVFGDTRHFVWNYGNALREVFKRADAVVCATAEQKNDISQLSANVHVILDLHEDYTSAVKSDYSAGDTFNFVWEGLPLNVRFFSEIRSELRAIQQKRKFALHLVTAAQYGRFLSGKVWKGPTIDLIAGLFDKVYLYSWNELTVATIITAFDLALIPIPLDDPLNAGKPENKLLIFWRMGVPAIVSATPAYSRVMEKSGIKMAARTSEDWREKLEYYMTDEAARRDAGKRGRLFVEEHHTFEKTLCQWDQVFESILA